MQTSLTTVRERDPNALSFYQNVEDFVRKGHGGMRKGRVRVKLSKDSAVRRSGGAPVTKGIALEVTYCRAHRNYIVTYIFIA